MFWADIGNYLCVDDSQHIFAENEFFFTKLGGFCYIKLTMTDYNCRFYAKKCDIDPQSGLLIRVSSPSNVKVCFQKGRFIPVYLQEVFNYLMA